MEQARVEENYDAVLLQEELKQQFVENEVLKQKITDLTNTFKSIEDSREGYLLGLTNQLKEQKDMYKKLI